MKIVKDKIEISEDVTPMRSAHSATSYLYIESPFKEDQKTNWFIKLFSIHPAVEERIKTLRDMEV